MGLGIKGHSDSHDTSDLAGARPAASLAPVPSRRDVTETEASDSARIIMMMTGMRRTGPGTRIRPGTRNSLADSGLVA